jgi:hypothetical protein
MKIKIIGMNTFLAESSFLLIMVIFNFFPPFYQFLRIKEKRLVRAIRNTVFPILPT